jgi:hypothetical protein
VALLTTELEVEVIVLTVDTFCPSTPLKPGGIRPVCIIPKTDTAILIIVTVVAIWFMGA